MKYTTPPENERFHNPENAPAPPEGWRFCLESEVREDQDWCMKGIPCRSHALISGWGADIRNFSGVDAAFTYIVPDTTPWDIPADPVTRTEMAYPSVDLDADGRPVPGSVQLGLSKREWFAGMVMQGMMATIDPCKPFNMQGAGQVAVQMADALIAELNRKEEA